MVLICLLPTLRAADSTPYRLEAESLERAAATARSENRHMLIAFLGEGWSVRCKRFKEQVLETMEFEDYARDHLVYFPVEARRRPKLTSEETAVLQSWVVHFDIKAYPTFILLAPDGQELLRHGYKDMNAREYVELLQAILPGQSGD